MVAIVKSTLNSIRRDVFQALGPLATSSMSSTSIKWPISPRIETPKTLLRGLIKMILINVTRKVKITKHLWCCQNTGISQKMGKRSTLWAKTPMTRQPPPLCLTTQSRCSTMAIDRLTSHDLRLRSPGLPHNPLDSKWPTGECKINLGKGKPKLRKARVFLLKIKLNSKWGTKSPITEHHPKA